MNQETTKAREANELKLKSLLSKIEKVRKELSGLVSQKKEIQANLRLLNKKDRKLEEKIRMKPYEDALLLIQGGMSAPKVAERLGISKFNMAQNLRWAWHERYPAHYELYYGWEGEFRMYGAIIALRLCPPLADKVEISTAVKA